MLFKISSYCVHYYISILLLLFSISSHSWLSSRVRTTAVRKVSVGKQCSPLLATPNNEDQRSPPQKENVATASEEKQYAVMILRSANELSREMWDSMVGKEACPFLYYDWINTLEQSDCASAEQGWQPLHVVIFRNDSGYAASVGETTRVRNTNGPNPAINGTVVAIVPLYAKYHSYGEFIFDQSWAQFAEMRLGIKYYPKVNFRRAALYAMNAISIELIPLLLSSWLLPHLQLLNAL